MGYTPATKIHIYRGDSCLRPLRSLLELFRLMPIYDQFFNLFFSILRKAQKGIGLKFFVFDSSLEGTSEGRRGSTCTVEKEIFQHCVRLNNRPVLLKESNRETRLNVIHSWLINYDISFDTFADDKKNFVYPSLRNSKFNISINSKHASTIIEPFLAR